MDVLYEDIEDPFFREDGNPLETEETPVEGPSAVDQELGEVKEQNSKLKQQNTALKKNISCLYKTARLEIERKENAIKELLDKVASLESELQVGAQVIYQQYFANCYGNLEQPHKVATPELKPNFGGLAPAAVPYPALEEAYVGNFSQQQQEQQGLDLSYLAANPTHLGSIAGRNEFASVTLASHGGLSDTNGNSLASSSKSGSCLATGPLGSLQGHPVIGGMAGSLGISGVAIKACDKSAEFDSEDSTTWEFNDCSGGTTTTAMKPATHCVSSKRDTSNRSTDATAADASKKQQAGIQKHHRDATKSKRTKSKASHSSTHHKARESGRSKDKLRRRKQTNLTSSDQDRGVHEVTKGRSQTRHGHGTSVELNRNESHCTRNPETHNHDSNSRLRRSSRSPFDTAGVVGSATGEQEVKLTKSRSRSLHGSKESTPVSPHKNRSMATSSCLDECAVRNQLRTEAVTPEPCATNETIHQNSRENTPSSPNKASSRMASKSLNDQGCHKVLPTATSGDANKSIHPRSSDIILNPGSHHKPSSPPSISATPDLSCQSDSGGVPLQFPLCKQDSVGVTRTSAVSLFDASALDTEKLSSSCTASFDELTPRNHFSAPIVPVAQFCESNSFSQFNASMTPITQSNSSTSVEQFCKSTSISRFSESSPTTQSHSSTPITQLCKSKSLSQLDESTPTTLSNSSTPVTQFCKSNSVSQFSELTSTTQSDSSTPVFESMLSESTPTTQSNNPTPVYESNSVSLGESTPATQSNSPIPASESNSISLGESTPTTQTNSPIPIFESNSISLSESTPTTQSNCSTPVAQIRESTPIPPPQCEWIFSDLTPVTQSTTSTQYSEGATTPVSQSREWTPENHFNDATLNAQFSKCSNLKPSVQSSQESMDDAELPTKLKSVLLGLNVGVANSKLAQLRSSKSHRSTSRSSCSEGSSRKESNSKLKPNAKPSRGREKRSQSRMLREGGSITEDSSLDSGLGLKDDRVTSKSVEDSLKFHSKGTKLSLGQKDSINGRSNCDSKSSKLQHEESAVSVDSPASRSQRRKSAHCDSRLQSDSDSRSLRRHTSSKSRRHNPTSASQHSGRLKHGESTSLHDRSSSSTKRDCLESSRSESTSRHDDCNLKKHKSNSLMLSNDSRLKSHHSKSSSRVQLGESRSKLPAADHSRLHHSLRSESSLTSHYSKSTPESRSRRSSRHESPSSRRRTSGSRHHLTSTPRDRHKSTSDHYHRTSRLSSRANSLHVDNPQVLSSGSRKRSLQEDRYTIPQKHHKDSTVGLSLHSKRLRKEGQCSKYGHSTPDSLKGEESETSSISVSRCGDESTVITLGSLSNLAEDSRASNNHLADIDRESLESGELLSDFDDLESGELSEGAADLENVSSVSPMNMNSSNNCNGNDQDNVILSKVQDCELHSNSPQTPPTPSSSATVAETGRLDYSCFNFSSSDISLSESSDTLTSSSNCSHQNQSVCTVLSRTISNEVHIGNVGCELSEVMDLLLSSNGRAASSTVELDPPLQQANSPSMYLNSPKMETVKKDHTQSTSCDPDSLVHQLPQSSEHVDPSLSRIETYQPSIENAGDCDMFGQLQELASKVEDASIHDGQDSKLNKRASTPFEEACQLQPDPVHFSSEVPLHTSVTVVSMPPSRSPVKSSCDHKQYPCENLCTSEASLRVARSRRFDLPLSPKPIDSSIVFSDSTQWVSPSTISSCDDLLECANVVIALGKPNSPESTANTALCSPVAKAGSGPPSAEVTILDTSNNYTNCIDQQSLDTTSFVFLSPVAACSTATQDSSSSSEESSDESIEEGEISDSSTDSTEEVFQNDSVFEVKDDHNKHSKIHSPASINDRCSQRHKCLSDSSNLDLEKARCHLHKMRRYSIPERRGTRERDKHCQYPSRHCHRLGNSHDHHRYSRSHNHYHHAERSRVKVK